MLCSCSRVQYVPLVAHSTDTLRTVRVQRDSVTIRDSVWRDRYVNGDTVYITQTKYQFRDRTKTLHDTLWRTRTDSVTKTVVVPAQEKRRSLRDDLSAIVQLILGGALIIAVLYIFQEKTLLIWQNYEQHCLRSSFRWRQTN